MDGEFGDVYSNNFKRAPGEMQFCGNESREGDLS